MSDTAPPPEAPDAKFANWLQQLGERPYAHGFYPVLRRFEAAHPQLPRLGEAKRPADEPLRVAQPADLSYAPAPVQALQHSAAGTPRLQQRIFGLLGPNGPLPIHLTELTRDRVQHHADPTLQRFLDALTQRFALLFYRAWAQGQPVLGLDRPGDDPFARRLAALAGLGEQGLMERDAAGALARLHFMGRLSRQVRDADGLSAWFRIEFDVPLRIEECCGHWLPLDRAERTRLGARAHNQGVGQGAVAGSSAWDVQHKFRIVIGPLTLAQYHEFLPGGQALERLQAMVRQWQGLELDWDLQLILAAAEVPALRLHSGSRTQLGRTSWMQQSPQQTEDRRDLILNVDRALQQHRRRLRAQRATDTPSMQQGLPHE